MADAFAEWYEAVNVEWPQFGMTEIEAAQQETRWRRLLGQFPVQDLEHAMLQALKRGGKPTRPSAGQFYEWAREASGGRQRGGLKDRILPHWTRCSCGCGGRRWEKVLRDPVTNAVRHFPATVEAMTAKLTPQLARNPKVRAELELLCDRPMTRTQQECKANGGDPLPADRWYLGLDNGVPVYDPDRLESDEAPVDEVVSGERRALPAGAGA